MNELKEIKRVVGLKVDFDDGPPKVVLKGSGTTAEHILDKASKMENGPLVVKDKTLFRRLDQLPIDAPIDRSLFQLVALLLVHIYAADAAFSDSIRNMGKGE